MIFSEMDMSDEGFEIGHPERFFSPIPPIAEVDFGALSDVGKVREQNEDHFAVVRRCRSRQVLLSNLPPEAQSGSDLDAYTMVVADGIGGAAFGELASMLALQTGMELGRRETHWFLRPNSEEREELTQKFDAYVQLIHKALVERTASNPELTGMGTTLTCAYTLGNSAMIAHVGDSRAYLYRQGTLTQLTHDHTLAEVMLEAGFNDEDTRRFRSTLVNCLGGEGDVITEVRHLALQSGDALLLCSDGLTDLVDDKAIAGVLGKGASSQSACQALVQMALDGGGRDNVTVVLARYQFPNLDAS